MKRQITTFAPVIVHWEDAATEATTQYDSLALAIKSYEPSIRASVGFFVGVGKRDGRSAVIIATEDDRSLRGGESIGGMSYIPTSLVTRVEVLQRPQRAMRKKVGRT